MLAEPRVQIVPGDGIVVRTGPIVAVVAGEGDPRVCSLIAVLHRLGDLRDHLGSHDFSRSLLGEFARAEDDLPAVGAVAVIGGELVVVLYGDSVCRVSQPDGGEVSLRGRDAALALATVLRGPFSRVTLCPDAFEAGVTDPLYHLGAGVVPARAAIIVGEPDDASGLVDGIACPEGHFNHPFAVQCAACGVSLLGAARNTVRGMRASLGTITFDEGTSYELRTGYVLGREPEQDPAVEANRAEPLRLEDPEGRISRVHAEVRLSGWDVQIVDRGSANGTYVLAPESREWHRLTRDEPQTISPGTRITVGRRVMTYDW